MQKIVKKKDLEINTNECFICFEDGFYLKCKAIGKKDVIFTGQIIPILDRMDFALNDLHFCRNEIFIFSDQFADIDSFIENAKENQVVIIPDKKINFNSKLLEKMLSIKNFLVVYDISFEEIATFLERKNIYCGIYFSSKSQSLNIDFIYKKISFLQKIEEINLNNSNITQYIKKYTKKKINIFRKKAIIIDLGIGSEQIKDLFCEKYNVFILNVHTDLEVINDLNPDLIIFSDGFCNPNLAYKTIDNLVNFCINSNIEIYGFGCGMFIIAISIGIKCKLIGFNYQNNYIFNYQNQIIKNRFFFYYSLENIESKKITNKIQSADKKYLYGFIYKYNRKKVIGINNIENLKYLI